MYLSFYMAMVWSIILRRAIINCMLIFLLRKKFLPYNISCYLIVPKRWFVPVLRSTFLYLVHDSQIIRRHKLKLLDYVLDEKFVSFIVRLLAHNSSIFAVSRKGPPMAVRVDSSMTEKSGTFVITSDKGITNGTTKATKSNIGVSNAGNSTWQTNQGEFSLHPFFTSSL